MTNADIIYDIKRKMLIKYPRFGSEIATANIEYRNCKTAATDGKKIYIDSDYFASLSDDDRLFLVAHEVMHIKFRHMFRLVDKDGVKRDMHTWNIATDAIINANLERDGFRIKEGYVNMPEALNYTAEEFYQKLEREKQEKQKSKEQTKSDGDGNNQEENQSEGNENRQNQDKPESDDHSMWEEALENQNPKKEKKSNKDNDVKQQEDEEISQNEGNEQGIFGDVDEKEEFEKNREEKIRKFQARRKKVEKNIRNNDTEKIELGGIGESEEEIDWKLLTRRELDKSETIWSQRRSIAENNYAYRLEENEIEDESETEVMIDVSGSVNLNLVKAFLRQLKPLIKQSKLRVGCFNEKFWGFTDIKSVKDIDNFIIPKGARGHSCWTEDWDLAVRSFTKRREINKIVFTDGYPCPGTMPKEDLKRENVIWLVYGNKDFEPCCGKVINITEKQLQRLNDEKVK